VKKINIGGHKNMNELISINYENAERFTVSGRELHAALGIETRTNNGLTVCASTDSKRVKTIAQFCAMAAASENQLFVPTMQSAFLWQKNFVCFSERQKVKNSANILYPARRIIHTITFLHNGFTPKYAKSFYIFSGISGLYKKVILLK